jgi:hypothetical protein
LWKLSFVPFLRLFLIVLEKRVVAQGHWRHNAAGADAGAAKVVPNSMKVSCGTAAS